MKSLFKFTLPKKVETEETIITQEEGKDVKTIKIVDKEIPIIVAIKKPTRELIDDGKMFYAVETSKAHQNGVISEVLLRKRLMNDGGVFSESEKAEFGTLYLNFFELSQEYNLLDSKNFDTLTEPEKEKKKLVKNQIGDLAQKISIFESNNSQLFENTVETLARNASMRWWILQLLYIQKVDEKGIPKDEYLPLFGVGDYKKKLDVYDKFEESNDEFYFKTIKKGARLISHWYMNQANTEVEFKVLSDSYDSELLNEVQTKE